MASTQTRKRIGDSRNSEKRDQDLRKGDWSERAIDLNLKRKIAGHFTVMVQNLSTMDWNAASADRSLSWALSQLSTNDDWLPLDWKIEYTLQIIQAGYYPLLAIVGVPCKSIHAISYYINHFALNSCS